MYLLLNTTVATVNPNILSGGVNVRFFVSGHQPRVELGWFVMLMGPSAAAAAVDL